MEGLDQPVVERGDLGADIAVLVVREGPIAGSQFALTETTTTAGRHPESDIFLDDVTVSRRHAEIVAGPDGYVVRDVGSLNGTYLNRERIEEAPLRDGDELQIGKFKLVVVLGEPGVVAETSSHLSIGEVLNLLQDEFPDITISKIRFLESQGLLDPERTPSGYRKFYEEDIERLRWILRQQKENFLPLKVIKDRLASGQLDDPDVAPEANSAVDGQAALPIDDVTTPPEPAAVAQPAVGRADDPIGTRLGPSRLPVVGARDRARGPPPAGPIPGWKPSPGSTRPIRPA